MTRLLLAEDDPVQSLLIRKTLEQSGYAVDTVPNGRAALVRLATDVPPDLVLTDMLMPEMDGLELVKAIRGRYSSIPVILMTAQGTDELVVEALESGAAGYVPKGALDRLVDEVSRALQAARLDCSSDLLLHSMTRTEYQFELKNDPALFEPLLDLVLRSMATINLFDSSTRVRTIVALEHALLNAMYRGNLEITRADLEADRELLLSRGNAPDLPEQRRKQSPYGDRRIHLEVRLTPDEARFMVRDDGAGFDVAQAQACREGESLPPHGGRGLLLMRSFMDEVTFNAKGNEVTLVKRRERDRPV